MPIFLLIRHGQTDYNKKMLLPGRLPGIHLNRTGRDQVQALSTHLAGAPIKAIYSSPLERTMETAEPIASALHLEITPLDGLLETDCGEWQGQSLRKLKRQKLWPSVQLHPSLFHFPGGESIIDCQHRMVQVLESLRPKYAPQDLVACFSHSDPIKLVVTYHLGLSIDQFQRLTIDPASVTMLQVTESGSRLILVNSNPSFTWEQFKPQLDKKAKPR